MPYSVKIATKHVFLETTALTLSPGVLAEDFSISATAKLNYGNFATGNFRTGYANPTLGNITAKQILLLTEALRIPQRLQLHMLSLIFLRITWQHARKPAQRQKKA